jgi:hypothetical protein
LKEFLHLFVVRCEHGLRRESPGGVFCEEVKGIGVKDDRESKRGKYLLEECCNFGGATKTRADKNC